MSGGVELVYGQTQELPRFTIDVAGHAVDLTKSAWRLNWATDNALLNWEILDGCDEEAVLALKTHIIRFIETKSPSYVATTFRYAREFLCNLRDEPTAPSKNVTLKALLWHLEYLRKRRNGYMFHHIRQWYRASADRLFDGFSDEVVFTLDELRIEGGPKGYAVLSLDPAEGPLSQFEEAALRSALIRDIGPIEERAALWLCFAFGLNPSAIALLREEDFEIVDFGDSTPPAYFLNIPRMKKRKLPRADFKRRAVDTPLAEIIMALIARNRTLNHEDSVRPLFRLLDARPTLVGGPIAEYAHHPTTGRINEWIHMCVKRLNVASPRTGEALAVTPRRLRYTFACKMVRQGVTPRELAELLDHTDTQNVQVYYNADSRFVERLDATIAEEVGPQIRAFMGEIVQREGHDNDVIPYKDMPGLGQCGAAFICSLSPHRSCYRCTKFRPFEDGPHEAVLEELVDERDSLLRAGNERIAEQLDATIFAAGEVVAKIKARA